MSERDLVNRLDRYGDGWSIDTMRVVIAECDTKPEARVQSFPASDKTKDPRHRWYVEHYGQLCWELDVLSPAILRDRVEGEILDRLDVAAWNQATKIEAADEWRRRMEAAAA